MFGTFFSRFYVNARHHNGKNNFRQEKILLPAGVFCLMMLERFGMGPGELQRRAEL